MKYALLLMGNVTDADCGEDGGPDPAEFMAFDKEITDAGIVVGGFALDGPEHGVRVSDSVVTSGPFAESGEFVGGSYVIEVPTIDDAIAWAKRSPGSRAGHIEIGPVADY
ncbi:YciI family protein [Brevibacterium casei]|uniref:YCII-like protein n=3 Tax=Brevibacterium casei TaxID=33889 RepID=K9APN7_9MICO|nr:YciI family protein [Brevibacterium casei]NNV08318.1 hypothetical protein [Geobacillus sp. MMMUD3]EKU49279.1 YCII-like protein [Brevibacterium casei S18]KZE22112.1 hypothetical protein AVW13_01065 [Brevibacterium casei]MBE4695670.1 hypothetical protein [Brevibacterium casei]MBY3578792.1 hypothetical protein [Brevibacterium casei]